MHTIHVRNINDAYYEGMQILKREGKRVLTRNGEACMVPMPVTTHYQRPTERLLLDVGRDANPIFHLIEALWMLDGREDTSLLGYLVPNMLNYAEPETEYFHGAYGYRWRHFRDQLDQLKVIIKLLKNNARDRRVMLQMWDCEVDLGTDHRDIPCNTMVKFQTDPSRPSELNMVVFCRSNDAILGCYGANAVHFSILLEYVAAMSQLTVGWYEQVSCDFHMYEAQIAKTPWPMPVMADPYANGNIIPTELVLDDVAFDEENAMVIECLTRHHVLPANSDFANPIFSDVVRPCMDAYGAYRDGDAARATAIMAEAVARRGKLDWLVAAHLWFARRVR